MNESPRKRLSTWAIVGIVAASVVGVLLIGAFWIRSVTDRRWARFQAEMKARAAQERARDPRRPVLRGVSEPGNAWDDYKLALAEMKKAPDRDKLKDIVQHSPKADPSSLAAMIEQSSAILDPLRRGASRSTSRYGFEWEKGFSMPGPGFLESQQVVQLAVLKARSLLGAGKPREAAALLLDASQFGRDMVDDGLMFSEMVGLTMLSVSLDGVRELAASERADPESLADLDRGLEALDGGFPKHPACSRREFLGLGMSFAGEGASMLPPGAAGLLPRKLLFLDAFGRLEESFGRYEKASEASWAEGIAEGTRVEAELEKAWNPILKIILPPQGPSEKSLRERVAQLRLLRVATHWRRTGELLDLDDPFGDKLRAKQMEGGLKAWSVGSDGIDGGGSGEWNASKGPDIVLEARR